MALINCPECGKEISSAAKFCGGCGHELANITEKEVYKKERRDTAEFLRKTKRWSMRNILTKKLFTQ